MSKDCSTYHVPVLLTECLTQLAIKPDGIYLDGTLGGGGHSQKILEQLGTDGRLICLDRDQMAIEAAKARLAETKSAARYDLVQSDFANYDQALEKLGVEQLDGVLLDLGVSSAQLDIGARGFSYMEDGPLDMRMDQSRGKTAQDLVNQASEEELADILWKYGEERYSRRIAAGIVAAREKRPISMTHELVEIITASMPGKALREKQHPAKRSFQALRIAVNDELGQLEGFLDKIPDYMAEGGRILIISFHSLEDRLVKHAMRTWEQPCTCPSDLPRCVCGKKSLGQAKPRKSIVATEEEVKENPRSRSARLRVFVVNRER
ncbi:MAG: 16S rRNA (cytosine(1402)-N(4))-methyltransferase RsmH [Eubacteriales bacterium]|nr:16S rRNA (cytosine(1402)-N(4))-methyltransferase RsmH [Eubacteriales bacterium]